MGSALDDEGLVRLQELLLEGIAACASHARSTGILEPPFRKRGGILSALSGQEGDGNADGGGGGARLAGGAAASAEGRDARAGEATAGFPAFHFDYGFNGLRFLADYLQRRHPRATAKRRRGRDEALSFLLQKGEEARAHADAANRARALELPTASGTAHGRVVGRSRAFPALRARGP